MPLFGAGVGVVFVHKQGVGDLQKRGGGEMLVWEKGLVGDSMDSA
jgi:hypothetical protein